ncbi:MAG: hypothetical protein HDS55_00370 [Barnesiella sp.]|nr:hypothetical protein [Barnesiella sp.]
MKAAYHCFVMWTADNEEWRNVSEKNKGGEGVKNTEWLKGSVWYSVAFGAIRKSRQSLGV